MKKKMKAKDDDYKYWVSCLELWECKILEQVLLDLEGYEYMSTLQKQIDKRIASMLDGFGFSDE